MRTLVILLGLAAAVPAGAQQIATNTGRVYEVHEVEVLPRAQNAAEFTAALSQGYPPDLRQAGVGGTVQVGFVVGADGQPREVRVVSTPDSSFVAPTVQAVSLLRFTPAQVAGQPVAVRVEQPITWRVAAPSQVAAADAPAAAADTAEGYQLSEVEEVPRPINGRVFERALARAYPPDLRDLGVSGQVMVRFRVEPDGSTSSATILSTTHRDFAEPTLRAVQVLRFSPGRKGGRPVRTWVMQPINWTVAGPGPMEAQSPGWTRRGRLSDIIPGGVPPTCGGRPC